MRVLFIRRTFIINSALFTGHAVVSVLRKFNYEVTIASCVVDDETKSRWSDDPYEEFIGASELKEFSLIYVEGGFRALESSSMSVLNSFVQNGGSLILADVDRNDVSQTSVNRSDASRLFGAHPLGAWEDPHYIDEAFSLDSSFNIHFATEAMALDGDFKRLAETQPEIAVSGPIALKTGTAEWLLTSTSLSSILCSDVYVHDRGYQPWATFNHFGLGYSVLIGARFTHPEIFNSTSSNGEWLVRLLSLIENLGDVEQSIIFRAGAGKTKILLESEESSTLERKSSFFATLSGGSEADVTHAVAKSIAAFCNTDGGVLIVGQSDDKSILGLDSDMIVKKRDSLDKLQLLIYQALEKKFGKKLVEIGVLSEFIELDGKTVAIFHCPRASEAVHTRDKSGTGEIFYVREGNASKVLVGEQLTKYVLRRFR